MYTEQEIRDMQPGIGMEAVLGHTFPELVSSWSYTAKETPGCWHGPTINFPTPETALVHAEATPYDGLVSIIVHPYQWHPSTEIEDAWRLCEHLVTADDVLLALRFSMICADQMVHCLPAKVAASQICRAALLAKGGLGLNQAGELVLLSLDSRLHLPGGEVPVDG